VATPQRRVGPARSGCSDVFRGRIWTHAPRWGAKGALSGEARVDRVGEDGDVSKVAGRSRATEGFHEGQESSMRHDFQLAAPVAPEATQSSRQMGNGMRREGHNAT
jgi:hypothetical protein